MTTPLRILFAGTPEFAVPSLQALLQHQTAGDAPRLEVVGVYTQPDRPAGRGRQLQASAVKRVALAHGIEVVQPVSFKKDPDAVSRLRDLDADLFVVVAYGLLLPDEVLEAPRLGCVNVHASLLPRWRGAAPIQRALMAGDEQTGVCIMAMESGLDTGPVYHCLKTPIGATDTGETLHDRLATLGAGALIQALPGIADGSLTAQPQAHDQAIYAHKLSKDEAMIDWQLPAEQIERQVRAFDPWPVAQTRLGSQTLRIWGAQIMDDMGITAARHPAPGVVISTSPAGIAVATGNGTLLVTRIQPPGKRAMAASDYLHAHSLEGARFT